MLNSRVNPKTEVGKACNGNFCGKKFPWMRSACYILRFHGDLFLQTSVKLVFPGNLCSTKNHFSREFIKFQTGENLQMLLVSMLFHKFVVLDLQISVH